MKQRARRLTMFALVKAMGLLQNKDREMSVADLRWAKVIARNTEGIYCLACGMIPKSQNSFGFSERRAHDEKVDPAPYILGARAYVPRYRFDKGCHGCASLGQVFAALTGRLARRTRMTIARTPALAHRLRLLAEVSTSGL